MFSYVPKDIDKEDVKNMKMTDNNVLQITYNDDSIELVYNQLIIEDLKALL
jgi:predicted SAM-dependent methyltransferase